MPFTREDIRESVERAGDEHWKALRDHHEDAYPASRPTPGDVCKAEAERLNEMGLGDAKEFELVRSEEHTSELQSRSDIVCRLLLVKKILTSRLSLSKHLAHNLGNLLLLGKIGVFHNRRNASSRLLLLISKHLILCIYLVFLILA